MENNYSRPVGGPESAGGAEARKLTKSDLEGMDFYARLGVKRDASDQAIRSAFAKLSMQYHPDRIGSTDVFSLLSEAYEGLSSDDTRLHSRAKYDAKYPLAGLGEQAEQVLDGVVIVRIENGAFKFFNSKGGPVSKDVALATGIVLPRIKGNMIELNMPGMSITQNINGTMVLTFEKGKLTSSRQGNVRNMDINTSGGGNSREVKAGGRIDEGNHTLDVGKISNLERIAGGVVSITGNGTITMERISGGIVNIRRGVTVKLSRISGGVVNIEPGALVIASDRLSGGVINGRNQIRYPKNTGAIVN